MPARTAPANGLPVESLHRAPDRDGAVSIDATIAGWRYLSFQTRTLAAVERLTLPAGGRETAVVVLGGGGIQVTPEGSPALVLDGRQSVWDGLPWAAYLPAGTAATITATPIVDHGSVDVAIASAPSSGRVGVSAAPLLIRPGDCTVEVRGAGNASRQITHILPPDFPADRIMVSETYTPGGNWSSWPPHKHDEDAMPQEAVLEETYSYRFRRPGEDWAIQRVYRREGTPLHESSGPRDGMWVVRHGDTVIVSDGYHPFATPQGVDAYYINALAGDRRTMACSFDPDFDWIREEWPLMAVDPRVPMIDHAAETGIRRPAR